MSPVTNPTQTQSHRLSAMDADRFSSDRRNETLNLTRWNFEVEMDDYFFHNTRTSTRSVPVQTASSPRPRVSAGRRRYMITPLPPPPSRFVTPSVTSRPLVVDDRSGPFYCRVADFPFDYVCLNSCWLRVSRLGTHRVFFSSLSSSSLPRFRVAYVINVKLRSVCCQYELPVVFHSSLQLTIFHMSRDLLSDAKTHENPVKPSKPSKARVRPDRARSTVETPSASVTNQSKTMRFKSEPPERTTRGPRSRTALESWLRREGGGVRTRTSLSQPSCVPVDDILALSLSFSLSLSLSLSLSVYYPHPFQSYQRHASQWNRKINGSHNKTVATQWRPPSGDKWRG